MTFSDIERLGSIDEAEGTFTMTEEAFRAFYDQTARPVWAYLARMTGDRRLADDLLQECYYRFLRANPLHDSDDHRRNYLFRIATNLVHDHRRRPRSDVQGVTDAAASADVHAADRAATRIDLERAMGQLKPRERSLLWLAYAQGCSHEEIAQSLGLKAGSLKALLFRARRRLIAVLGTTAAHGGRR